MLFVFPAGFAIKDFRFGVGRDAEYEWRRLEADWLVKARLEVPPWPVHQDDGGTFGDADDPSKLVATADDVVDPQPEWMLERLEDKAEKLALFADVFHGNPPRISTTPSADN